MPQRQSGQAQDRENATTQDGLPRQRAGAHDRSELREHSATEERGGTALVAPLITPERVVPVRHRVRLPGLRLPRGLAGLRASQRARDVSSDVLAVVVAALDVWLVIPQTAPVYSIWLCWLAVPAMLLRRHVPFVGVLITIPGFFAGWSQLAAMMALGALAKRHLLSWRTVVGAVLVGLCRFILWPWSEFLELGWRQHFLDVIYGVLVAGMPVAIGMLITVRKELSTRILQLARSREREKRLYAATVRSAERAKLAREMHDVVSHQVTLIAMQAGAMQVDVRDQATREAAETIRTLSTRTLEELRELVGVLRSGVDDDEAQPGLEDIPELVHGSDVRLAMDGCPSNLPGPVSRAAYRTVQEALTNVRKHAAGARASVRVRASADALVVEISNDRPRRLSAGFPSGGHGLLGLRERAGLLGGSFDAGPTPEGGFSVRARYPLSV
ncbi:histidine kinase [Actinokineospora sp. NBRC 105648]|uniref:sensor histidine kinase n=1 Tax=Actinokineospora sp. NBRC 105648 TaxID=3032206 RepID=UPI0024A4F379|nr:histidine kinase [Actinokineospora sp. NBRC 105648]GLZ36931.1 two-component sensor histidine kinase [Actinokineospora sp. NBRC 105648]